MSGAYWIRRVLRALLTAAGVVLLVFLLVRLAPGDPVDAMLGETASAADRAAMRARLHLDAPWGEQLLAFAGDVASGTLGRSFRSGRPVAEHLGEVAGPTVVLALASLLLALLLAIPLGALAALRGGATDGAARTFAVLGLAVPNMWLGPMLLWLFAMKLGWLPLPAEPSPLALVLPVVTLGTALSASLMRQTRGAVLRTIASPAFIAARAKGLRTRTLLLRHAIRPSLFPVLTLAATQLGALFAGAVVVEQIFERPGIGGLFVEAFFTRDLPMIQGVMVVVALAVVGVQLLLDVAYAALDPRVRQP
ncbi:MAG: ABC transporter permease [Myxococcota bacterium]